MSEVMLTDTDDFTKLDHGASPLILFVIIAKVSTTPQIRVVVIHLIHTFNCFWVCHTLDIAAKPDTVSRVTLTRYSPSLIMPKAPPNVPIEIMESSFQFLPTQSHNSSAKRQRKPDTLRALFFAPLQNALRRTVICLTGVATGSARESKTGSGSVGFSDVDILEGGAAVPPGDSASRAGVSKMTRWASRYASCFGFLRSGRFGLLTIFSA